MIANNIYNISSSIDKIKRINKITIKIASVLGEYNSLIYSFSFIKDLA